MRTSTPACATRPAPDRRRRRVASRESSRLAASRRLGEHRAVALERAFALDLGLEGNVRVEEILAAAWEKQLPRRPNAVAPIDQCAEAVERQPSIRHDGSYWPAARKDSVFFVAWSISSGVSNTVVLVLTVPVAAIPIASAAAVTLSGTSTITTTSLSPNAK